MMAQDDPERFEMISLKTTVAPDIGQAVYDAAESEHMSVATWLRRAIMEKLPKPKEAVDA